MIKQSNFVLFLGTKISRTKFLETFRVIVFQATIVSHGIFHQNWEDSTKIPVFLEAFCFLKKPPNIYFESCWRALFLRSPSAHKASQCLLLCKAVWMVTDGSEHPAGVMATPQTPHLLSFPCLGRRGTLSGPWRSFAGSSPTTSAPTRSGDARASWRGNRSPGESAFESHCHP